MLQTFYAFLRHIANDYKIAINCAEKIQSRKIQEIPDVINTSDCYRGAQNSQKYCIHENGRRE